MRPQSVLALIAGVAVGAVLGVLYAPEKGEETRKKLMDEAEDLAHDAHVRARYVRRELYKLKKSLAEKGEDLKEDVKAELLDKLEKLEAKLAAADDQADDQPQEA